MVEPILSIIDGTKLLPNGSPLFRDLNFNIVRGESVAIVGRSGSGKSSLLSVLGLLDRLDAGIYRVDGTSTSSMTGRASDDARASQFGFVFQKFALISHLSALENVMLPLRHLGGRSESVMRSMGHEALSNVELGHLARRLPRRLSGGEQQRVAIARALVHSPDVVLADEPTGSLDQETGLAVVEVLRRRVSELGTALVIVTHDMGVARLMDRVLEVKSFNLEPATEGSSAT